MSSPVVSFVVPCYKLAHLLRQCVQSITSQTFRDIEVLIMDDCSPDNTAEVAAAFNDPRVKHVRNEQNLGNLRNYNKGIALSRGKYVWLISADDYLRQSNALERYVDVMERNPHVGYIFCPGVGIKNGQETQVMGNYSSEDRIVPGHEFLKALLDHNIVPAPCAMARRESYQKVSMFPLDANWAGRRVAMEWAGDWYLWCAFALFSDVAYLSEPMVSYREHELSMTTALTRRESIKTCAEADLGVLSLIRHTAKEHGMNEVSQDCLRAIGDEYSRQAAGKKYRSSDWAMSRAEFEELLGASNETEKEKRWIRSRFDEGMGDRFARLGSLSSARTMYASCLRNNPARMKAYAKLLLLFLGHPGSYLRHVLRSLRKSAEHAPEWQ